MRQNMSKFFRLIAPAVTVALVVALPLSEAFAGVNQTNADCPDGTLGGMVCNFIRGTSGAAGIFPGFSYMFGLILGVMAILKLRQHVESPNQVPLADSIKRFFAGGAFFAAPYVVDVVRTTIDGNEDLEITHGGWNGTATGAGLDAMIVKLMENTMHPIIWAVSWIGWLAGLIFVFIGISRLLKSEQEGPRGPTGIGTITTFLIAGALFSLNSIVVFFNTTIFGDESIQTNATLQYTQGLGDSAAHVHAVISAIIAFSVVIGWISLVRGLFIVRSVSEGHSQASMMAALTHLIGGTLAINLGAVVMAVQETLNITPYGIQIN